MLALTLIVTSPFLYCFSRLAILEPMLIAFTLAALNLAVRLPRMRRPVAASCAIGLLFTLMVLTKTTGRLSACRRWAGRWSLPLWQQRGLAVRCLLAAAGSFAAAFGLWMALVDPLWPLRRLQILLLVNQYHQAEGVLLAAGQLLVVVSRRIMGGSNSDSAGRADRVWALLLPAWRWQRDGARKLLLDPVFGASMLAVAGSILFMAYQNHPQPRYFAVAAFFCFFIVAQGAEALLGQPTAGRLGLYRSRRFRLGRGSAGRAGRGLQRPADPELRPPSGVHLC